MKKTNIQGVYQIIGKKDTTYYIRYRSLDKVVTEKVGKKSDGMTTQKAYEILQEYKTHDVRKKKTILKKTFDDLAKLYFEIMYKLAKEEEDLEEPQKVHKTTKNIKKEESIYNNFWKAWNLRRVEFSRVKEEHVRTFITKQKEKYSDKSIYNAMMLARSILKHTNYNGENPFNIKKNNKNMIKKRNARKRFLSIGEVQLLLEAARDRLAEQSQLLILMAITTGARPASIINLKNKDINFPNKKITFYDFKRKMNYTVPLPSKLIEPLKQHKKGRGNDYLFYSSKSAQKKPMSEFPREIQKLLDELFNRVDDDERVVVYSFRHTFANILLQVKKVPIQEVSHLLNHASIQTTIDNYINMEDQYLENNDLSDII